MFLNQTTVMGIVNLTPDSFYDGGKFNNKQSLLNHVKKINGSDIIDVGCESSRPNSKPISELEEMNRISLFFDNYEQIKKIIDETLLSIDSYKAEVVEFCLKNGFNIINDISGGGDSFKNIELAIDYEVPIVLMHMQGIPSTMQNSPKYDNIIDDIRNFFEQRIEFAIKNGLNEKNIILDPGIGFGKTIKDNDNIILNLNKFKELGFELLVGISRKSFLSKDKDDKINRLYPSLGVLAMSVMNGADIVRVHDVDETKQMLSIVDRIKYKK
ncbi:MAG: dihydropteroate synthase [Candidatus Marinimicrobia bacterium]|nr:dihydropteroate synthase [Candidatus Neomarinimicrobiota bacterium]